MSVNYNAGRALHAMVCEDHDQRTKCRGQVRPRSTYDGTPTGIRCARHENLREAARLAAEWQEHYRRMGLL